MQQPTFGVCYGMQGDNLPSLAEVIQLYKNHNIGTVWLYDPNPEALRALVNSGISVILGTKNEDLHNLASSVEAAKSWIDAHVERYQGLNIKYIVVGNEVIPGELAQHMLLAMRNLQSALSGSSFSSVVMTTVVSGTVLGASYPLSSGTFTDNAKGALSGILQFLSDNHAPLLIIVYPYFAYAAEPTNIRLDHVQFTVLGPVVRDRDLSYWNLLNAMVDAHYAAIERERGFPYCGHGDLQVRVTFCWKSEFHSFTARTDLQPKFHEENQSRDRDAKETRSPLGNIFMMFNRDLKSTGVEQNFGLFYPDGTPVYPIFL